MLHVISFLLLFPTVSLSLWAIVCTVFENIKFRIKEEKSIYTVMYFCKVYMLLVWLNNDDSDTAYSVRQRFVHLHDFVEVLYFYFSLSVRVCVCVCVCVCLSVCPSVNKMPIELLHRFGRGFH